MHDIVKNYLENILKPKLSLLGVNDEFINLLIKAVRAQMTSALRHWDDESFRNTLMLIVSEEAPFYIPDNVPISVRSFVVLTLRNSPFESLQSDNYEQTGLSEQLDRSNIIRLTKEAIGFFAQYDLTKFSCQYASEPTDIYLEIANTYPLAWNALSCLANSSERICDFEPIKVSSVPDISRPKKSDENNASFKRVIKDGYDENLDDELKSILYSCKKNGMTMFVDCFKMISRNPKLLFFVLEYLLANDIPFATSNYFILNGHAEKRKNVLKAAHNRHEIEKHISNSTGISPTHKKILLGVKV